ncbi:MAG TPA: DNA mismatch repair endonuclease MutL [Vicinamibacterales bacterium]|jgi:DNA mismatch repair protein MutL|nr:DNA mismatch repair endonuclease MutL [Vicinamibacterales bacterium]
MGKIHRLPSDLANQIAAGEVVERPASVIKELVENSIDAGAKRLTITVEFGGKKLIRVEDDGEGMDPEDARLAIERHATSKIRRADDLERIATLGFRGEALPSIASVSHFVLRSRARGTASGTEIRVNGGAVASVAETGMPEGTSIEVADLFYNLPARRKFLKSDGAESAQVSRVVTQLALCYPEIGFTLTNSGRKVLQCPPVAGLRDRLYQLYGERPDLIEVRRDRGDVTVTGYIAALAEQGPTRGPQNVFVNRRIVKDRTIAHAIIDSYSVASIKERSPEVHLFIEMPFDALDVNVHPTKAEVRFRDQSFVHEVIRRTLGDALGRGPAPELILQAPSVGAPQPTTLPLPASYGTTFPSRWAVAPPREGASARGSDGAIARVAPNTPENDGAIEPLAPGAGAMTIRPMMPLGQFRDTFIIAVDEEGIAIIDQHVAHERVLFERITERLTAGRLESQRLLEPLLVNLPPSGRQALLAHGADLERLGFEIEEFGGDTIRVSAYPAVLRSEDCDATLRTLADDLEGLDRGSRVEEAIKKIAATMACHAAVKANYPLTAEKMAHILDELRRTAYSTICPHGRPVMLRLTRREVEKNFQRI